MHGHRRLAATLLLSAATLGGCQTWQRVEAPLPRTLAAVRPDSIRVTRHDEERVVLHGPRIVDQTLFGDRCGDPCMRPETPVALALEEVLSVEVRRLSWGRTIVGAVLGTVVGRFVYAMITAERPTRRTGGVGCISC